MHAGEMADTFKMLANPHRVNIVRFLYNEGRSGFVEMMEGLGLDPKADCGNFGYHLSELGKAGIVTRNRKGLYTITPVGERIWSLMSQLVEEVGDTMGGEGTVSVTEFEEQDIADYAKFINQRVDRDAAVPFVEDVARYNHWVNGPYGSFDGLELRAYSYIARSVPDGEVVGLTLGHTFFNPNPGYALYGEKRLTLRVKMISLSPDCDEGAVFSLLVREMVKVADKHGYHLMLYLSPEMSEEEYVKETMRDHGLALGRQPWGNFVAWLHPKGWLAENTFRRLKTREGFNKDLVDLIAEGERIDLEKVSEKLGIERDILEKQILKLEERGILSQVEGGWELSEKYRKPTRTAI